MRASSHKHRLRSFEQNVVRLASFPESNPKSAAAAFGFHLHLLRICSAYHLGYIWRCWGFDLSKPSGVDFRTFLFVFPSAFLCRLLPSRAQRPRSRSCAGFANHASENPQSDPHSFRHPHQALWYCSGIVLVLFWYCSSIVLVSSILRCLVLFWYCSGIVLVLFWYRKN